MIHFCERWKSKTCFLELIALLWCTSRFSAVNKQVSAVTSLKSLQRPKIIKYTCWLSIISLVSMGNVCLIITQWVKGIFKCFVSILFLQFSFTGRVVERVHHDSNKGKRQPETRREPQSLTCAISIMSAETHNAVHVLIRFLYASDGKEVELW